INKPSAWVARIGIKPLESIYLTQDGRSNFTELKNLLYPSNRGIEPSIVSNAKLHFVGTTGRNHPITFDRIHCQGFLAKYVLACLGRGNGLRCVQVYGCCD